MQLLDLSTDSDAALPPDCEKIISTIFRFPTEPSHYMVREKNGINKSPNTDVMENAAGRGGKRGDKRNELMARSRTVTFELTEC